MKPIWFPIFIALVLVVAIRIAVKTYPWGDGDAVLFWMAPVLWLMITGMCVAGAAGAAYGISIWIGSNADCRWQKGWGAKMVSMRSADGIHGSIAGGIFMMSGYVDSAQTYFFYTLNDDGSFQPQRWRPDGDTSVYEEAREDGYVQQYTLAFKHPWVSWFGSPDGDRVKEEFHIPKGSLKQQFKLQ